MKPIVNKIIKVLILSDITLLGGIGFVTPIFAVFLTDRIQSGNVKVAGYAAAIYWIVKSLVVIPFAKFLDRNHGEKDDLVFIIIGNILAALAILGYIFSKYPWHIYVLQAFYAVGMGMNVPGYTAIFTRHVDQGKEAFNWGIRSALVGVGSGATAALGGIVASCFGFDALFIGVAVFVLVSALVPVLIIGDISPKNKKIIRRAPTK